MGCAAKKIYYFAGGTPEWKKAGYPLVTGD
jgi:3-mercaptopyruvate sulfurtransferase SseA